MKAKAELVPDRPPLLEHLSELSLKTGLKMLWWAEAAKVGLALANVMVTEVKIDVASIPCGQMVKTEAKLVSGCPQLLEHLSELSVKIGMKMFWWVEAAKVDLALPKVVVTKIKIDMASIPYG